MLLASALGSADHLCAIYSGSSPPAKSQLAFLTWNPGLNSTSPRLIDISDPNCPLFQRKPLLCLLLPSPPLSKCCPTLSTYRVTRNVGGSLIFFRAAILLLFCLLSLSSSLSTLSLSLSSSLSQYCWNWLLLLYKTDFSPWGLFIFASFRKSCLIGIFGLTYRLKYKWKIKKGNK